MITLELVSSGGGGTFHLPGMFATLDDALLAINELDKRYGSMSDEDWDNLSEQDPMSFYEGCDVYAKDGDRIFSLDPDDNWEDVTEGFR